MILPVLVLYPATRLAWLALTGIALTGIAAGTIASMPGKPWSPASHAAAFIEYALIGRAAPVALLAAAAGLVTLCVTGRWQPRRDRQAAVAGVPEGSVTRLRPQLVPAGLFWAPARRRPPPGTRRPRRPAWPPGHHRRQRSQRRD